MKKATGAVNPPQRAPRIDHLVIAAASLDEGVDWCEATLGVTPGPGGEHALFGTHNRLLKLDGEGTPQAYLEIIAIHPTRQPTRSAPLKRWFDLDHPGLQQALATEGPQLIHWVASVPRLDPVHAACAGLGLDPGRILVASRPTPAGLLEWRITVRDDGHRLWDGCWPTLIEWGKTHPTATMPDSGLRLRQLSLSHPEAARLAPALAVLGLEDIALQAGPVGLHAELETPLGRVRLHSHAIRP